MLHIAALAGLLLTAAGDARDASVERGQARWYRDTQTASGERYDPDALTCAHRSAPFGARLRVTHRERLWCSPHCLRPAEPTVPDQLIMFDEVAP